MRLRDLTTAELADVAARRERVREALAGRTEAWVPTAEAIAAAPFLDDWELRAYPGTSRPCLRGLCWGHPGYGDTVVNTSIIAFCGPGWVITEGCGRLYVLGREGRPAERPRITFGRRGVPPRAPPPRPAPAADIYDDLPPIETPGIP